jgi:hypothetical protein
MENQQPNKNESVTLSYEELHSAASEGIRRNVYAHSRGLKENFVGNGLVWERHIVGAIGERAVCKWLGVEWNPAVNDFQPTDADGGVQIKFSNTGFLYVPVKWLEPNKAYVLVSSGPDLFTYVIKGALFGADAQSEGALHTRPDNGYQDYWVPESRLRSATAFKNWFLSR